MKAFVLAKIAEKLKTYKFIKRAFRVDENLILLQFDNDRFYFDLTKGSGDIYINIDYPLVKKFKAPFDIVLEKKFTKSKLIDVYAKERILTIVAKNQNRFKEEIVKLRFEFTGRYTNAIILDENDIVIESLRHISENISSRVVKPGVKLTELESIEIKEKVFEIDDLEKYTQKLFSKKYQNRLNQKKESILKRLHKKIKEIEKKLSLLENEEELLEKARKYKNYADVAMANLHLIKPFMKELKTKDFEGSEITIPIPELKNINEIGNFYYKLSKKAKNNPLENTLDNSDRKLLEELKTKLSKLKKKNREYAKYIVKLSNFYTSLFDKTPKPSHNSYKITDRKPATIPTASV